MTTQIADSCNSLGFDIWSRMKPGVNLALSPFSTGSALAMTYGGARGVTAAQMAKVLHIDLSPDEAMAEFGRLTYGMMNIPGVKFLVANRLFGEQTLPFHSDFTNKVNEAFAGGLFPLDFRTRPDECRVYINNWVASKTKDRIKDLLPPQSVYKDTSIVLTNAAYFLGFWQNGFDAGLTTESPFYMTSGERVDVQTMFHPSIRVPYGETDDVRLIELPYIDDCTAMIVLPRSYGIDDVEKTLNVRTLTNWRTSVRTERVNLWMPRFELAPETEELVPILKSLGMETAFSDDADFTGIAPTPPDKEPIKINSVPTKVFIKTDESGTEAAAATAVSVGRSLSFNVDKIYQFKVNHPFLFLVQENSTGAILFMGRISNPK